MPFAEAGLLRVDLDLAGLKGAVSWEASGGMAFGSGAPVVNDNDYKAGGVFSARELAEDPREATRELLDPFMVTILAPQSDVVRSIQQSI